MSNTSGRNLLQKVYKSGEIVTRYHSFNIGMYHNKKSTTMCINWLFSVYISKKKKRKYKTQGYLSTTMYNYTELWVSLAASLQRQGRGQGGSLWSYQLIVSTATEMLQHGDVTNQYIYSTRHHNLRLLNKSKECSFLKSFSPEMNWLTYTCFCKFNYNYKLFFIKLPLTQ